ncbi:hypothetical protein GGI12_004378, partial [Dipsacomyces acuminosporus]
SGYPITGTNILNCRDGPDTSYDIVRRYTLSDDIKISCQVSGQVISGNDLWDKTQDGCFVSDYYVKTDKNGHAAPKCEGSASPPKKTCPAGRNACTSINDAGVQLIKEFEGFVAKPEPDPIGLPTVGYGHLCKTNGCAEVKQNFPLTPATAEELLRSEIPEYARCFVRGLKGTVILNDNQLAALISWVYNVGCGAGKSSSLVERLNKGEDPNTVAKEELIQWNKAGGRVFPGLTRRREAETKLFITPSSKQAFPKCQG